MNCDLLAIQILNMISRSFYILSVAYLFYIYVVLAYQLKIAYYCLLYHHIPGKIGAKEFSGMFNYAFQMIRFLL